MDLLGAFINNVGERTATALNDGVLGGGGSGGYIPNRGLLITSAGDYFVDASGNHIAYAQQDVIDLGVLLTSTGANLTDSAGNHIASFQIL